MVNENNILFKKRLIISKVDYDWVSLLTVTKVSQLRNCVDALLYRGFKLKKDFWWLYTYRHWIKSKEANSVIIKFSSLLWKVWSWNLWWKNQKSKKKYCSFFVVQYCRHNLLLKYLVLKLEVSLHTSLCLKMVVKVADFCKKCIHSFTHSNKTLLWFLFHQNLKSGHRTKSCKIWQLQSNWTTWNVITETCNLKLILIDLIRHQCLTWFE